MSDDAGASRGLVPRQRDDTGHTNGFGGNGHRANGGAVSVESPHHIPAGGLGAAGGPAADGAASDDPARSAGRAGEPVEARNIIECLLLARGGILKIGEIKKVLDAPEPEIRATLAALTVEYGGRGLQIQEVAGGYQLCTRPEYGAHVQRLLRLDELDPLTRARRAIGASSDKIAGSAADPRDRPAARSGAADSVRDHGGISTLLRSERYR